MIQQMEDPTGESLSGDSYFHSQSSDNTPNNGSNIAQTMKVGGFQKAVERGIKSKVTAMIIKNDYQYHNALDNSYAPLVRMV